MRNNEGKAGVYIVVLAVIILLAAVPWYFIIVGNLGSNDLNTKPPAPSEEPSDTDPVDPDEEDDPPDESPPPENGHEGGQVPGFEIPTEYNVDSIRVANPDLFRDLNMIAAENNAVAVSLAVFDGETGEYYTYEFGHADTEEKRVVDTDTKFRVASLAKLVTAICAMTLVDEGLVDLDTDISVYLGYEVVNVNYPGTAITTRMLMQHTSSIFDSGVFQQSRDNNSSESLRTLLERGSSFRHNEPGTQFQYTNFGYSVIGAICENVSGKSLDTFAREVLFEPLGIDASFIPSKMHDTENIAVIYNERHVVTQTVASQLEAKESSTLGHDLHLAQGNLTINMLDYAKILAMLGNGGVFENTRILTQESVSAIHNTDVEGTSYKQGLATRYSFGDFVPELGFYWHTGSGYGLYAQYIFVTNSNTNRGVVVTTTGASTDREPNGMVSICTDLSRLIWNEWDSLYRDDQYGEEQDFE